MNEQIELQKYRVEVNAFGNAFNVEKRIGNTWIRVIGWLNEDATRAWIERLKRAALVVVIMMLFSSYAFSQDAIFKGKISQITPEGALFFISEQSPHLSGGMNPNLYSNVFLFGDFSRYIDGQRLKVWGKYIGQYKYETVLGANATIYSFRVTNRLEMQDGIYNY